MARCKRCGVLGQRTRQQIGDDLAGMVANAKAAAAQDPQMANAERRASFALGAIRSIAATLAMELQHGYCGSCAVNVHIARESDSGAASVAAPAAPGGSGHGR